jgi:hypothetical protein
MIKATPVLYFSGYCVQPVTEGPKVFSLKLRKATVKSLLQRLPDSFPELDVTKLLNVV